MKFKSKLKFQGWFSEPRIKYTFTYEKFVMKKGMIFALIPFSLPPFLAHSLMRLFDVFCKVEKLGIEILGASSCLKDLSIVTWVKLSGFLRPNVPQGFQRVRKVDP